MSSVSSQPQFCYIQPPSKVLHLRNLPWECTEEELIELGKPFGKVVNTKCNVGANRNQAFIEFAELNQFLWNSISAESAIRVGHYFCVLQIRLPLGICLM
ncbi:hypothetical protein ACET3Z_014212 [Daucus carota]